MTYIILAAALLIFIVVTLIVVFAKRRSMVDEPLAVSETGTATNTAASQLSFDTLPPLQTQAYSDDRSSELMRREAHFQPFAGSEANRTSGNAFPRLPAQEYLEPSVRGRSLYERDTPLPQKLQSRGPLYDLEREYERGMQANYDDYIGAVHLLLTHVVMKTPAEVELAFQICTRKIQAALQQKGLERAPLLVDIAGLTIGGDATTVWGQSLKACWDKVCVKGENELYLAAHYNSHASPSGKEQLQEKIRRIQLMTSAVLNDFQSNIFDTREEAVAFLQRLRELSRPGHR
ncbi:hypothetical protein KSF_025650 [Reticulibacter mediterranei]|uniref:Uncharacterized protein n=1 Tax=Reticulibacter mediterranei TaxID=2778369 RepID=A0A8J3IJM1_9CHLR|nr:hypothetical protein [Reticulibacter mediterranei]GHO92517.1 hypothetical protein KSF_025650 [Reticulibacter mediterranei]